MYGEDAGVSPGTEVVESVSTLGIGKLVKKEGEWLERYVEAFFKLSGFRTRRNVKVGMDTRNLPDVTHEFDVVAEFPRLEAPIYIECKDVDFFKKELVDIFVGKLSDVTHSSAILVTSNQDKEDLLRYRNYCARKGIGFFDGNEVDGFLSDLARFSDIEERRNFVLSSLGIPLPGKHLGFFGWLALLFRRRK
jgi:hypothetical protein